MAKKKKEITTWKTEKERQQILNQTLREINKKFGMDGIHYAKDEKEIVKLPFGIPKLDEILGGGIVYGGFTTLWGTAGSGKTSLAYYLTAQAQKQNKIVYYIALEPFDKERAQLFGVDLEKLIIGQFPKAEEALNTIIELSRKKLVDVIILDSLSALSPIAEQEEKSGKERGLENEEMATVARKLSKFFRIAIDPIKRANIAVLLIGQTRMNVGFIAFETLSGGNALKHYSKLILHIKKGQKSDAPVRKIKKTIIDEEGFEKKKIVTQVIGFDVSIEIDKTQVSGTMPELTKIHLPFYFESGFTKKEQSNARSEKFRTYLDKQLENPEFKEAFNKEEIKLNKELKRKRGRPKKEGKNVKNNKKIV